MMFDWMKPKPKVKVTWQDDRGLYAKIAWEREVEALCKELETLNPPIPRVVFSPWDEYQFLRR